MTSQIVTPPSDGDQTTLPWLFLLHYLAFSLIRSASNGTWSPLYQSDFRVENAGPSISQYLKHVHWINHESLANWKSGWNITEFQNIKVSLDFKSIPQSDQKIGMVCLCLTMLMLFVKGIDKQPLIFTQQCFFF